MRKAKIRIWWPRILHNDKHVEIQRRLNESTSVCGKPEILLYISENSFYLRWFAKLDLRGGIHFITWSCTSQHLGCSSPEWHPQMCYTVILNHKYFRYCQRTNTVHSPSSPPSNKPNSISLAPQLARLANLCMLFILLLASGRINNMAKSANFVINDDSEEKHVSMISRCDGGQNGVGEVDISRIFAKHGDFFLVGDCIWQGLATVMSFIHMYVNTPAGCTVVNTLRGGPPPPPPPAAGGGGPPVLKEEMNIKILNKIKL